MSNDSSAARGPRRRPTPSLTMWVTGVIALSLLALVAPGVWAGMRVMEGALVNDAVKTLKRVQQGGTAHLDDMLVNLETSAFRLGRLVSALPEPDLRDAAEFDRLMVRDPDGCFRSRVGTFDDARNAVMWVPPRYSLDDREKARFISIKRLLEAYHTGLKGDPEDGYVLGKSGGDVMLWPGHSDYIRSETADTDYYETDWMVHVRPDKNPEGRPRWTPAIYDPIPHTWSLASTAPFYRDGVFAGSVGQDVLVDKLMAKLGDLTLYEGMSYSLVRADGTMLVSDAHRAEIERSKGTLTLDGLGDPDLSRVFAAAKSSVRDPSDALVEGGPKSDRIFVATHLAGPDWYLLSVTPRAAVLKAIRASYSTAWYIVMAAIAGLFGALTWVMARVVIPPVKKLVTGAERVSGGALDHDFEAGGAREFDRIAEALNVMVTRIRAAMGESERSREALSASEAEARSLLAARTQDEQELRSRLALIEQQQQTIRSLQTPLIQVWNGVLALPIVGPLDGDRARAMTEDLLQAIVRTQAGVAIIDLTGADLVDESTANHLLKIFAAVKLLGARGVVTGIRSETAQLMVALGVDITGLTTLPTLREAIHSCMRDEGQRALGERQLRAT